MWSLDRKLRLLHVGFWSLEVESHAQGLPCTWSLQQRAGWRKNDAYAVSRDWTALPASLGCRSSAQRQMAPQSFRAERTVERAAFSLPLWSEAACPTGSPAPSPRAGSCFSSTWVLTIPVSADCPRKASVLWALFKKQDICQPSRHAFLRFSLFWGSCLTFELPFLKEGNSASNKMPDRSQNWTSFLYPPLFFFNILVESSARKFSVRLVVLCPLV